MTSNGAGKSVKFTSTAARSKRATARPSGRWPSAHGTDIPHLCYSPEPGYRADGNCRACMVEIEGERVLAASCIRKPSPGMKVKTQIRARQDRAPDGVRAAGRRPAGASTTAHDPQSKFWAWADRMGVAASRFGQARATRPRPTAAIRPWRSISTPASSAISACAPAAKCRSTTSSAWPAAATPRRSCSTSTIRWAPPPASPAANACRPARPAR